MVLSSEHDPNILTTNTVESTKKNKGNNILEHYGDIFKALNKSDGKYKIKLSENAKPTIYPTIESSVNSFAKIKKNIRSFTKCRCCDYTWSSYQKGKFLSNS